MNLEQTARKIIGVNLNPDFIALAQGYLDLLAEKKDQLVKGKNLNESFNKIGMENRTLHSEINQLKSEIKAHNETLYNQKQSYQKLSDNFLKLQSDRTKLVEGLKNIEQIKVMNHPQKEWGDKMRAEARAVLAELGEK